MCKTKYLVYFIANRSSVSKVLEENSIIDPIYIYVLPFRDNNSCFRNKKYVAETNFDLQLDGQIYSYLENKFSDLTY